MQVIQRTFLVLLMKTEFKERSSVHASHVSGFNSVSVLREILEFFKDIPPPYPAKTQGECMTDNRSGYLLPDNAREFRIGI